MEAIQTLLPNKDLAINAPKKAVTPQQMERIKEAAIEFEAVFLNEMLKPMFEDVNSEDPAFGGSREESIYQSMMIDKVSTQLAQTGGIGIAKHIEAELLRMQEA